MRIAEVVSIKTKRLSITTKSCEILKQNKYFFHEQLCTVQIRLAFIRLMVPLNWPLFKQFILHMSMKTLIILCNFMFHTYLYTYEIIYQQSSLRVLDYTLIEVDTKITSNQTDCQSLSQINEKTKVVLSKFLEHWKDH